MSGYSFLSTYPPTRCGLATFTESLATAIAHEVGADSRVVRMMDELARPATAPIGTRTMIVDELDSTGAAHEPDFRRAAQSLSRGEVAVIQHEYGIFGGADGADVIRVMEHLTVPSVVVLHTVLDAPTAGQRAVLERVAALAGAVVVMTEAARTRLAGYDIDPRIVSVIPHGVADWTDSVRARAAHRTVLTWGLIGPGKGIEHGIRAFARLAATEPDVHYRVSGQTHPKVLAHDGDGYRESLHALVDDLGLRSRVTIDGQYLDAAQLAAQVGAADAVLLPYDSRNQVTSGVLVEAIAAGKPVVATAFPHAVELLGAGVGVVVAHEDPAAIAEGLRAVLAWRPAGGRTSAPAPAPGTSWAEVALRYREAAAPLAGHRVDLSA